MNEQLKNLIHAESMKWNNSPVIELSDNISYVQQVPWIQNKTIWENITFGKKFDEKRYKKVIQICELERDLQILPSGD